MRTRRRTACGAVVVLLSTLVTAAPAFEKPTSLTPKQGLVIGRVGRSGRVALHTDAIEALLVTGRWKQPRAGDTVALPNGSTRRWQPITADENGEFRHRSLFGGYAFFNVAVARDRTMILEAQGHSMVYVNGEPRVGDVYQTGYVRLPIRLHAGDNHLLFSVRRGRLRFRLVEPSKPIQLDQRDATLPDLVEGEPVDTWAALVVINSTDRWAKNLLIRARLGATATVTAVPPIPPLAVRKVGFRLQSGAVTTAGKVPVLVELRQANGKGSMDQVRLDLSVVAPTQPRRITFVSRIDGSVQYYALNPMKPKAGDDASAEKPALFLTCHGAGVEAIGQARAYRPKDWGHIVAPTNRRPFGFDWEDWGRLDALEVLELAQKSLGTDPRRTYLTGHSMGGHGTWHLGVTFPDRFAAIGPSAGWVSMWSYAGAKRASNPTPIEELLLRCMNPSDTMLLSRNYRMHGVYVLHGEKDDNVPVQQSRIMRQLLSRFHQDWDYHEQPGAGHWWGNACVDWPPMFQFFRDHRSPDPKDVRVIDFTTASPGVSATCYWVTVAAQNRFLAPSHIECRCDVEKRHFTIGGSNVNRFAIDLTPLGEPGKFSVHVLSQSLRDLPWPKSGTKVWFERSKTGWQVIEPVPTDKGPQRYGGFKDVFRHRVILVYGTHGTAAENAWAFAKARYDAETFWYRGNGSFDIVPDTDFDPAAEPDRNVVLYGNRRTNSAWDSLLADCPVQVDSTHVTVDECRIDGDLACLLIRPRPKSDVACVGVVGGTSLTGMRLTDRLPFFVSGVAYPDCLVFDTDVLTDGVKGVRVAGFFGVDWSVGKGEFLFHQ